MIIYYLKANIISNIIIMIKYIIPIYVLSCGSYGAVLGAMMVTFGNSMGRNPSLIHGLTGGFLFGSTVGTIIFPYFVLSQFIH